MTRKNLQVCRCADLQMLVISCVLVFSSCGNTGREFKDGDTVSFPDTTAFKQGWKMEERVMLSDLFASDSFYNQLGLDTFELTYTPCDCPDWIDVAKLPLDCRECSDFYTDPAADELLLPEQFLVEGNVVRFYGVRIPGMNLPEKKKFMRSDPPAWTVVRYYGYEVIRPYKVWGPVLRVYRESGDTADLPAPVTIR